MRELLRLRHAQVAQLVFGKNVGQDVVHRLGKNHQRQLVELVVLGHAHVVQVLRNLGARNRLVERLPAFEIAAAILVQAAFARQHARDLPCAVGAEVEIDADVLVANLPHRLARARSTTTKGIRNSSVIPLL